MAKTKKKKKEATLEQVLWNCRVALRGYGSFEKNRDSIIGLAFLKFASDKFVKRRQEIIEVHGNIPVFLEKVSFYNSQNVYYLEEHCRWSYIVKNAGSNDIAVKLDKAMKDIEDKNPPLNETLPQNVYASLGADRNAMKSLIDEINKINDKRFHEEDLIGRVYEYFLQNFAASASKEDGEFYTPACVVQLISELIEPFDGIVYDPCCGSGGMFVQSMKFVDSHKGNRKKVSIVGQEKTPETWKLAKMNLAIRGIASNLGQKNASTFTDDQHQDLIVQYIMANPPFNLKNWRGEDELLDDSRFKSYKPAMPPKSNANYAWILHMLSKLDVENGIAGFLLANGALNAGSSGDDNDESGQDQYLIRKKIIENDKVEAIIVLPRDMFYTTDISVTLWILNNNKKARTLNGRKLRDRSNEVLFMDLRRWDNNIEVYTIDIKKKKKKVVLTPEQIEEVRNVYNNWQSVDCIDSSKYAVPELYRSVNIKEIQEKNFNLAPSKYIEFTDHDLEIDFEKEMRRIQREMTKVISQEKKSQKMLEEALEGIGYGIK
jgi:type I restriction enzyme M protein